MVRNGFRPSTVSPEPTRVNRISPSVQLPDGRCAVPAADVVQNHLTHVRIGGAPIYVNIYIYILCLVNLEETYLYMPIYTMRYIHIYALAHVHLSSNDGCKPGAGLGGGGDNINIYIYIYTYNQGQYTIPNNSCRCPPTLFTWNLVKGPFPVRQVPC